MAFKRQSDPAKRFNELTPDSSPVLGLCQLGFLPGARKRIIVRGQIADGEQISLVPPGGPSRAFTIARNISYDFGAAGVADFSDVRTEGVYRATFRGEETLPFPIAADAWQRALPTLAGYQGQQRCGSATNRSSRPTCHLDDARRRDNGLRVDTVGGWHDAGDLRKWVDATLMNLFGILALLRNLKTNPSSGALSRSALLAEAKYGNAYFLKMQDSDGLVWADVGGGVNGDNSDNHWTDNVSGTADDRFINVEKRSGVQAMFVMAQVLMSEAYSDADAPYATRCLEAAVRCWTSSTRSGTNTLDLAWWTLAAAEMYRVIAKDVYRDELSRLAELVTNSQVVRPPNAQMSIRGFFPMWPGNVQPLRDPVHSALPGYALLRASDVIANANRDLASRWGAAAQLYIDGYVVPMSAKSAYSIVPFGLFLRPPSNELYRPLGGDYSYRFFMPVRDSSRTWAGLNAHLLSHALLLTQAGVKFGEPRYTDLGFAQLEWVFGANPFSSSLATGLGSRQPTPFSPFVGPIQGGIMNGICGDDSDRPILDSQDATDWHCNEYWSPHVGYCQWILSLIAT